MTDVPKGIRFTLNYADRGENLTDSPRCRKRLLRLFMHCKPEGESTALADLLEGEIGMHIPRSPYAPQWAQFFEQGNIGDVLDVITVLAKYFIARRSLTLTKWTEGVERIFAEERMGYRLDALGGVHLAVDREFESSRTATLAGLGASRYSAARASFEAAHGSLDATPVETREAIKHVFDAVEIVFRLLLGDRVSRLGSAEVEKHLKPLTRSLYEGTARDSAGLLLNSFGDWVNAAHPYRHGQKVEQPDRAPLDLAVAMVATGSAFLRWLIELDQAMNQEPAS